MKKLSGILGMLICGCMILPAAAFGDLVINEINYHPDDPFNEEFVEIINTSDTAVDVSGYCLLNGTEHYVPEDTILGAGCYLVFIDDNIISDTCDCCVIVEELGSLANAGETLVLYDGDPDEGAAVIDEVTYDEESPWPEEADGTGKALQLIDPSQNNDDPSNWGAGDPTPCCINGDSTYVELASITAQPGCGEVTVSWETAAEINSVGFNVYRSVAGGESVQINSSLIPATGSATEGASYETVDTGLKNGIVCTYILEEIDASGVATVVGEATATPRLIYIFK